MLIARTRLPLLRARPASGDLSAHSCACPELKPTLARPVPTPTVLYSSVWLAFYIKQPRVLAPNTDRRTSSRRIEPRLSSGIHVAAFPLRTRTHVDNGAPSPPSSLKINSRTLSSVGWPQPAARVSRRRVSARRLVARAAGGHALLGETSWPGMAASQTGCVGLFDNTTATFGRLAGHARCVKRSGLRRGSYARTYDGAGRL
jgi:hypothetical protein